MREVERARTGILERKEPAKEQAARTAILADLVREVDPPLDEATLGALRTAMKGYSLADLRKLQENGVQVWRRGDPLPPRLREVENHLEDHSPYGKPVYITAGRLILLPPGVKASHLRHELGHALDDALVGPRHRLDSLPASKRDQEIDARLDPKYGASDSTTAFPVTVGGTKEALTMDQMFARYKGRATRSELAFDDFRAQRGHSLKMTHEFVAEGLAVFNGDDVAAQARLLRMAPELYSWLEQRNRAVGMPVPDRSLLERVR